MPQFWLALAHRIADYQCDLSMQLGSGEGDGHRMLALIAYTDRMNGFGVSPLDLAMIPLYVSGLAY